MDRGSMAGEKRLTFKTRLATLSETPATQIWVATQGLRTTVLEDLFVCLCGECVCVCVTLVDQCVCLCVLGVGSVCVCLRVYLWPPSLHQLSVSNAAIGGSM